MAFVSRPVDRLNGLLLAPGDKSCSHRALMFGGLAEGRTEVRFLLEGEDVLRTGDAMRALGASITRVKPGHWQIDGLGSRPAASGISLDFGNSGTGSRLMAGLCAGLGVEARFDGDTSLRSRPMGRVLDPLRKMGARFEASDGDRLPLTIRGGHALSGITYAPPVASAQVKSSVLLAGLNAGGRTTVRELHKTRPHTETMLSAFGVSTTSRSDGSNWVVEIEGGQTLSSPGGVDVPGDPSSAAFLIAAGLIAPGGDVHVEGVMDNPTRDGIFRTIEDMATLSIKGTVMMGGETCHTYSATGGQTLKAVSPPHSRVSTMIDEFPIFAVLAAFATGETVISGAEELRVKESDRIAATVNLLRVNGVEVEERPDGMVIQGCAGPVPGGGLVEARHDHRIAMSALVMGVGAKAPVAVDDVSMIATSYPDFFNHMRKLGADISESSA